MFIHVLPIIKLLKSKENNKNALNFLLTDGTTNATIEALDLNFFIDDIVNLKCISDGNPKANYIWKFNHTEIGRNAKYNISVDKTELSFTVTNITDSGYFQCVASNYIEGKWFISSSNVKLTVQESNKGELPLKLQKSCNENPCSSVQNCVVKDGRAVCSVNIWIVIAIVFIIITLILFTTTLSLILLRRAKRLKMVNNAEERDMGYENTRLKCFDILKLKIENAQLFIHVPI